MSNKSYWEIYLVAVFTQATIYILKTIAIGFLPALDAGLLFSSVALILIGLGIVVRQDRRNSALSKKAIYLTLAIAGIPLIGYGLVLIYFMYAFRGWSI